MEFLTSRDLTDLYIDAAVADKEGSLLFISVWGSEPRVQQLRGRLSVPKHDSDYLSFFTLRGQNYGTKHFYVNDSTRLESITGRVQQTILAHLMQVFIYDRLTVEPDRANRRCILLKTANEDERIFYRRIWQTIMNLSHIPLLPEWEQSLLAEFKEHSWVQIFEGFGIDACVIDLGSDEVETTVADMLRQGKLYIPN